jgi:hypothetical protein
VTIVIGHWELVTHLHTTFAKALVDKVSAGKLVLSFVFRLWSFVFGRSSFVNKDFF